MSLVADQPNLKITLNGEQRELTMVMVKSEFVRITGEAVRVDREWLRRFVEWGAFIVQVRPRIPSGTFTAWLRDGGCAHKQTAYGAIDMAMKYADAHGHFSEEKWRAAVERYNAGAVEGGYKPESFDRPSKRAVDRVGGKEPPRPANEPNKAVRNAHPSVRLDPNESLPAKTVWYPGCPEDQEAAMAGTAVVAAPTKIEEGSQPGAAVNTSAVAPDVVPAVGPHRDVRAAAGGSASRVVAGTPTVAAAATPPPPTTRGRTLDVAGQMTLADEYAQAERMCEAFMRGLRDRTVSEDLMRRFVELARAA